MRDWWGKLKKTQANGEIYHVCGLGDSILWLCQLPTNCPIDSMQS